MPLTTLAECADRIEAGTFYFRDNVGIMPRIARELRNGSIDVLGLETMQREARRLLEACNAIERISRDA
jgi:hypothetical protein